MTNNQLSSAQYDPAGRMISYSQTTYSWDVLDQMAKVDGTAAGSEAWTHVYDAAGERARSWRTSSSRVDTFTLRGPGGMVLSQFSKTPGAPAAYAWKDYVYREGQLLGSRSSDGTLKHFDVDHLGTVRLETNASGVKLACRELWPYGEDATPATNDERLRFTGHERDLGVLGSTADDMDYMHARYYRPLLGRFLSLDPATGALREPQSWNRYSYTRDNPLKFLDPNGQDVVWFSRNDAAGGMTNFGHTALRIFGENYDLTVDFGRYQGGHGPLRASGPGILRLWNDYDAFLKSQQSKGSAVGKTYDTSEEFDIALIQYFWAIAKQGEWVERTSAMEVYRTPQDYELFSNNCTTICVGGLGAAAPAAQPGTEDSELVSDTKNQYARTVDPRVIYKMISAERQKGGRNIVQYFVYTPPKKKLRLHR